MLSFYGKESLSEEWAAKINYHSKLRKEPYSIRAYYDYRVFAEKFGLPIVIPYLIDYLVYGSLPQAEFAGWARSAMRVGVDYGSFTHHWHHWLICDPEYGAARFNDDVRVVAVGELHKKAIAAIVEPAEWASALDDAKKAVRVAYDNYIDSTRAEDKDDDRVAFGAAAPTEVSRAALSAAIVARAAAQSAYDPRMAVEAAIAHEVDKEVQRLKFLELLAR